MKITSFIPLIFVLSPNDLGRLKTEINIGEGDQSETAVNGQKIVYTYGSSGDIIKREYYDVQASLGSIFTRQTVVRTDSFGYTNSNWKNQCDSTNINGVSSALTYDAIGNPLTYRDGMQMTWQNGRQLKKLTAPNGKMLQFSYDLNGQRQAKIERSYGNVVHTTKYFYDGTKLAGEKKDDTIVWYDYDENGAPVGMRVNGLDYIFRKNLQGDITGIYNSSDELIVEYSYADAWGAGVTVSGSAASTIGMYNSFRYRGYYYDTESGLYYLNSRYYDPVACRFINADSQLNTNEGNTGYNLYSYCGNNPVMYTDPSGHSFILACIIVGAVIGALAGGHIAAKISKAKTGRVNGWAVAGGIVGGGVLGGLAGWGTGAAITAIGAAATGAAGTAAAPIVEKAAEKASTALQTYYPPNNGFSGAIEKISLDVGTIIQRTGDLAGRFTAPAGTPSQMLSLPYDKIGQATTYLQTTQPIQALSGTVAPWFGQIGGGTQYLLLDGRVDQLLADGILKIFGE